MGQENYTALIISAFCVITVSNSARLHPDLFQVNSFDLLHLLGHCPIRCTNSIFASFSIRFYVLTKMYVLCSYVSHLLPIVSVWFRLDFRLQNIFSVISITPQAKYWKLKYSFLSSENFPIKHNSDILLCLECFINPRNLIKIVKADFEKIVLIFSYTNYP